MQLHSLERVSRRGRYPNFIPRIYAECIHRGSAVGVLSVNRPYQRGCRFVSAPMIRDDPSLQRGRISAIKSVIDLGELMVPIVEDSGFDESDRVQAIIERADGMQMLDIA